MLDRLNEADTERSSGEETAHVKMVTSLLLQQHMKVRTIVLPYYQGSLPSLRIGFPYTDSEKERLLNQAASFSGQHVCSRLF